MSERRYTTDELEAMPTLEVGYTADLKIETATEKVWLERVGVADGEICDNLVTHETLDERHRWVESLLYSGDDPDTTLTRDL